MIKNTQNQEVGLINYPILNQYEEILNFTSTRYGGVSSGAYGSFNLSMYSGDDVKKVSENRERLYKETNITKDQLIIPYQTHCNSVCLVDENFMLLDPLKRASKLNGVDSIVTSIPHVCIAVSTADCVPILMYDPVKRAIASVHAGWRGTCSRILSNTVRLMKSTFGTNPKDLVVAIGPSISPEVYEVGAELLEAFEDAKFDVNKYFARKSGALYLNLWEANKDILLEKGVNESNIQILGECTYSNPEKFFSARRLGVKSGRMLTGIMLK